MTTLQKFRQEFPPMLRLAVPIVLAEIGWMVMGIVDTIMVGRLPNSAEAIGAVSIGSTLFFAVAIFGAGLLLGLDTLVSQSFGAGDVLDCHKSLVSGVYLALILAPILTLVIWGCMPFFRVIGINPAVLRLALPYLKTLTWSLFPLLLYFGFRRYLQGMNIVKPITFTLVTANLVNLAGNWLLVYGHLGAPALGTQGSAWATVASRIYMFVILLGSIFYYDRHRDSQLMQVSLKPELARIRRLLALGLPAAAQFGLEVAVFSAATALIGKLDPASLAGHQIALNSASFTYMVPLGLSSAAAVRVGQALGRNDVAAASRSGWAALWLGSGFMLCAAIVFVLVPQPIVRIFTPAADVMRAAVPLLFVAAAFQLFDGLQTVASGALRGAGDTRTPMLYSILAYWLIGLPLGYYLCFRKAWGAVGIWIGLCLGLMIMGTGLLWVWFQQMRVRNRPST
jgi:MATE family multidrug resistance protein